VRGNRPDDLIEESRPQKTGGYDETRSARWDRDPPRLFRLKHGVEMRVSGVPSGQLHGPVIIAMITVRMVQPTIYEIVDMITMRHLFMSAVWTVCV
jgi:hypothetical protein